MKASERLRSSPGIGVGVCIVLAAVTTAHAQSAAVQRMLDDGDEAFAAGDYGRAASLYDRAIAAEPRTIEAVYYAKRADIFVFRKEWSAGLRWLTTTAEPVKSRDPLLLEKKAVLLDGAGRGDEAVALAETLVAANPKAFTLHLLIGNHHFTRKADGASRAVAAFDAFLTHRPPSVAAGDAMIRSRLSYALLYLGARGGNDAADHFERARKELTRALADRPSAALARTAHMGLCAAHTGLRQWKPAVAECSALVGADAKKIDPAIHYNLAVARLGLGDHAGARASAAAVVAARSQWVRAHLLAGDIEAAAGAHESADVAYRRAAELEPNSPDLALRMARRHLRRDPPELAAAAEALRVAHAAYPDSIDVLVLLAETLQRMGQSRDAAALAVEGAARPRLPAATRARMLLVAGDALYDEGTDLTAALGHYQDSLAAEPGNAGARAGAIDTLNRLAIATDARGDRAEARTLLERALTLDDASPMTHVNLGVVLLASGDRVAALAHLEKAHTAAPAEARTNWALGRARLDGGDVVAAERHLRAALDAAGRGGDVATWAHIAIDLGGLLTHTGKVDEAVTLLARVRAEGGAIGASPASRRQLAVAYLHRGLARFGAGQNTTALGDLDKADEDKLLEGAEQEVRAFAVAVARIRQGRVKEGRAALESLAAQLAGRTVPWLRAPYDKLGLDYYIAYSYYADDSAVAGKKAVGLLERLARRTSGELEINVKLLLRSGYQRLAFHEHQAGRAREARKLFDKARSVNVARRDDVLLANLAVLDADGDAAAATRVFEKLGDNPPEALVNLGVLLDRSGKTMEAYRVWKQARERGARAPQLASWIGTIERLLGPKVGEI